jgi:hypothetical protein
MRTGRRDQQGEAMPAPYYSFARRAWVAYVGLWQGDFFTGAEGVEAFADYQHALQASRFLARRAGRTKLLAVPCLEERTDEARSVPPTGRGSGCRRHQSKVYMLGGATTQPSWRKERRTVSGLELSRRAAWWTDNGDRW